MEVEDLLKQEAHKLPEMEGQITLISHPSIPISVIINACIKNVIR